MSEHLFERVRKRPTVRYGASANHVRNKGLARAAGGAMGGTGNGQQRQQDSSDDELQIPLEEQRIMPVATRRSSSESRNQAGQSTRSTVREVKQGTPREAAKTASRKVTIPAAETHTPSSSSPLDLPQVKTKAINASTPVKLIPEVVVYKGAPLPTPSLYIRKRRRLIEQSETEEEENDNDDIDSTAQSPERRAEADAPSPLKRRALHHGGTETKRTPSSSPLRVMQETPRPLKEEPSFPSLAIKSSSPERVFSSVVPDAVPEKQERDTFDDAFEDLLGPESQKQVRPYIYPKRPSLRQQMSARSDGESSSRFSSLQASPHHSPASSRTRTISDAPSPSKLNRGAGISPARSLKGTQSAPDVLAQLNDVFATTSTAISVQQEEPARAPSPAGKAIRKTYAEMRTIRQELDITESMVFPTEPPSKDTFASGSSSIARAHIVESYADLKRRLGTSTSSTSEGGDTGADISQELEEDLSESQIDLASINQLRSAGENRRFADEMDYLLEGLRCGQGIAIQRSSAVEIIKNLSDADFVRKLIACDYLETVYDCFRAVKAGEGDRILDTCLAIYISCISNDRRSAAIISRKQVPESNTPDCIIMLANILGRDWVEQDLQSPKGLSKLEKRLLGSINLPTSADEELQTVSHPSVRGLILQSLLKICSYSFTGSLSPFDLICNTPLLPLLASTLCDILPSTYDLSLQDAPDIEKALQILETIFTGRQQAQASQSLDKYAALLGSKLVNLLAACQAAACDADAKTASMSIDLLLTLLKFLVTVANASQTWVSALTPDSSPIMPILLQCIRASRASANTITDLIVDSESQTPVVSGQFDLLCLLMGLLEALLETQGSSRVVFRDAHIGTSCTQDCLKGCSCGVKRPAVCLIAEVYKSCHARHEQPEQQFLSKYCALVLIYASLDHEATVQTIFNAFEGNATALRSFGGIVKDLLGVHEQAGDDAVMLAQLRQLVNRLDSFQP